MRRLRPLSITDILDETAELFRSNFVLLIGISAIVHVPYSLLDSYMEQRVRAGGARAYDGAVVASVASVAVELLLSSIVTAALTFAISERYLGRPVAILGCFRRVLKAGLFFRFLAATAVKAVLVFGPVMGAALLALATLRGIGTSMPSPDVPAAAGIAGLILLVGLPWMVIAGIKLALVEPSLIVESRGPLGSLGRSWKLTSGFAGKAFLLYLIVGLVLLLIVGIMTGPVGLVVEARRQAGEQVSSGLLAAGLVLSTLMRVIAGPIFPLVTILLYYDIRMRKEGFDLELLANELDARTARETARAASALPQERVPGEDAP